MGLRDTMIILKYLQFWLINSISISSIEDDMMLDVKSFIKSNRSEFDLSSL